MLRVIFFFALILSAVADETLDVLVNAASSFSATIVQQIQMLGSDPSPRAFAEKTIDYATAKTAYFEALRATIPELVKSANRQERSPKLDAFAAAFAIAGDKQQHVTDEETRAMFKRFPQTPDIEQARAEFERAQKAEDGFHTDFDGLDNTKR